MTGNGGATWGQVTITAEIWSPPPLILNYLGGKGYDPEKADYSDFEAWLQCYYVDGMKSIRDHNGRTMWFKVSPAKTTRFDLFHTGFGICQDINTHNSLLTGRSRSHGTKRWVINSLLESENISWNRFSGGCTEVTWHLILWQVQSLQRQKRGQRSKRTMIIQTGKRYQKHIFIFWLELNKLQAELFNTALILLLGGQGSVCKHSEEKGGQTGNCGQNTKCKKGCTFGKEKKDGNKHASAWKEQSCTSEEEQQCVSHSRCRCTKAERKNNKTERQVKWEGWGAYRTKFFLFYSIF